MATPENLGAFALKRRMPYDEKAGRLEVSRSNIYRRFKFPTKLLDMVLISKLLLWACLWGSEGDTGESGAAVVITGSGETPMPPRLGLTFPRLQPGLDAAGYGDQLLQALAALGALGFLQVHGLRGALEAPQE